jgi:mRNA interferase YafQ
MPTVKLSPAFKRAAKKYISKHPKFREELVTIIRQLELNPREAWLETHKLRGGWKGFLACSAGHDLRIVFEFVENQPEDDILLVDLGTHDEVY